jgi:hypothetical protein
MEQLRRDERGLLRAVRLALPGDDCQLLLVIDQFEEVFTLVEDRAEMERFLDGLYIAAIDRRSPLRVVITLRADFYDRPIDAPDFSALIQERTEVVVPMKLTELERAVRSPAELVGVGWNQPGDGPGAGRQGTAGCLPLLQYALTELFERRTGDMLSLEDYQAMGGVEGVLERSAEAVSTNAWNPEGQEDGPPALPAPGDAWRGGRRYPPARPALRAGSAAIIPSAGSGGNGAGTG